MAAVASAEAAAAAARRSYGRLVAYLAARSHDIAAAEDALGDAFAAALVHWPESGVPASPEAWLLTAARRRLHDAWRHGRVEAGAEETMRIVFGELPGEAEASAFPDERLKLMFVCAHPAIDAAARPALMLQAVLGLDASRIASAFLVSPAALSQRLVRAKTKIRAAGIAFEVPERTQWQERLADVLEAVYAAYGTGWEDVAGSDAATRGLAREALELASMLTGLLPSAAEGWGLLALLAFCQTRASARRSAAGEYVPLASQDTSLWDRDLLRTGERALHHAARLREPGPFQLEAAIQSAHSQCGLGAAVPEVAIVQLYDALVALQPTTGAWVGRASALGAARGAAAGLDALAAIDPRSVATYQPYWATLAHLEATAGHAEAARAARDRAIGLATDPAVRRFLIGLG